MTALRSGIGTLALVALTACAPPDPDGADGPGGPGMSGATVESDLPRARPLPEPSEESRALAARYARVEADLRTRGLLRTDGGGVDAPYDAEMLTRNFVKIALFDEFVPISGRLVARETSSHLRRWESPVRIALDFGPSVPPDQRERDRATVAQLADRLAVASGHDITTTRRGGTMTVFVVNEEERRALGTRLRAEVPGVSEDVLRTVRDMAPSTFCLMIAFSTDSAPHVYTRAIGIVRAEHPPLLRMSCFHEEIAQGLGLANDSPEARPSIFNDDEEYALLTTQDELLLAILYDDRLNPGMTALEALPIVRTIAQELLPDERAAQGRPGAPSVARLPDPTPTAGDT